MLQLTKGWMQSNLAGIIASAEAADKAINDVKEAIEREKLAHTKRAEKAEKEHQAAVEQARKAENQRQLAAEEARKAENLCSKVNGLLEAAAAAEGDLTNQVEGDEGIDEVIADIKQMHKDLAGIIGQVTEYANRCDENSQVSSESARSLSLEPKTRSSRAEEVGPSIKVMNLIRTNPERVAEILQAVFDLCGEANLDVLEETIAAMEEVASGNYEVPRDTFSQTELGCVSQDKVPATEADQGAESAEDSAFPDRLPALQPSGQDSNKTILTTGAIR